MIGLITPRSTPLEAKKLSLNGNILNVSFSVFCYQMFTFFMKASILDFNVKILVFSPGRDKLS